MHAGDGAGEAVDGLGRADAFDVCKHPVEDADLGDGGDEGGDDLDEEHDAGRDLHVVPEFEVGGELDALGGGDVAVGDEDHVGDGAAGEGDAADKLADEVDAAVLVGDGHDDAVGDEEDGADGEGEEEAVPGEMDGIAEKKGGLVFDQLSANEEENGMLTIQRQRCQWRPWRQTSEGTS